ncbi:MAG: hypothetical protein ACREDX_11410 [Aestuariivirga sp.]
MRALLLCGVALGWTAVPAQADVKSYCEAYARNQADARLSGGGVLGSETKLTLAEWEERKTLALADCLALYTPKTKVEPATAEPETIPAKPEPKKVTAKSGAQAKSADDPWKSFDNPGFPVSR